MTTVKTSKDEPTGDGSKFLLQFLDGRSVPCPRCGYDLRDLTKPVCPECGEELALTVGRRHPNYELLIATLAPGIFSGIMAGLLLFPLVYFALLRSAGAAPEVVAVDAFGLASGFGSVMLFSRRRGFMKLPRRRQVLWLILAWAIHIAALAVFIAYVQ